MGQALLHAQWLALLLTVLGLLARLSSGYIPHCLRSEVGPWA